ncbi:Nitroreductase family protein [Clostridium cavendishii DSM 21758]|uniref:Nitroreductase family protein n=1 Tax=Clostridium cavendishii DSM 21758 TaxID=1121302 RepID=A0A1M6CSI1_9CLOT|nr:Nitroreductase family protein [Clostridium cavendishii DSM 21758]
MELKEYWYTEMNKRVSRRSYINEDIEIKKIEALQKLIYKINSNADLNIQLIKDCEEVFKGFKASYGTISGAKYCLALVGDSNDKNIELKLGYYGEALVLEATSLGLGTCWIGGTYNKKALENIISIKDDEKLYITIALGYVKDEKSLKEKILGKVAKDKNNIEDLITLINCSIPQWLFFALGSVRKAPSALNRQPWHFEYDGNKVRSYIKETKSNYERIDLGIALIHFALGAKKLGVDVTWDLKGDEAVYIEKQ